MDTSRMAALLMAGAIALTGCGPERTFAGVSDEQLGQLFPTEAEVASAVAGKASLGEPEVIPKASPSPGAKEPGLPSGVPESCRGVYVGTEETRAANAASVRTLEVYGTAGDSKLRWRLNQFPSSADANRFMEAYDGISQACEHFTRFDLDGPKGWGQSSTSADGYVGTSAFITVGDITMSVVLTDHAENDAPAVVTKLASIMEDRIKAQQPK